MRQIRTLFQGCVWLRTRDLLTHNALISSDIILPDSTVRVEISRRREDWTRQIELQIKSENRATLSFCHKGSQRDTIAFLGTLRTIKRYNDGAYALRVDYSDIDPLTLVPVPIASIPRL